jgi:hypothetical protein
LVDEVGDFVLDVVDCLLVRLDVAWGVDGVGNGGYLLEGCVVGGDLCGERGEYVFESLFGLWIVYIVDFFTGLRDKTFDNVCSLLNVSFFWAV